MADFLFPASLQRRAFLVGAAALGASGCAHAQTLASDIAAIEAKLGGRLGVSARDISSGKQVLYRADERFAMASTFKLALAGAVLARVDAGALSRTKMIKFTEADLLSYAPVTRAHISDGQLSIEALCAAAVEVSDNTAANLLLAQIGGPAALTDFLRTHGDQITRLDRTEPDLNTNLPDDPSDTTTPNAMRATMAKLLVGDALLPASRASLQDWLLTSTTGLNRLRGGLPKDWRVGDKTGNGGNGATNDIAIAWPPRRTPILIAVYSSNTQESAREPAFAALGRLLGGAFA